MGTMSLIRHVPGTFTREQLDGIREFLRLGTELSYRRAEELSAEARSR